MYLRIYPMSEVTRLNPTIRIFQVDTERTNNVDAIDAD